MQAMISPSTVVNVLQLFMTKMNWTHNIGIITDSTDTYFFHISEMLVRSNSDLNISQYIDLQLHTFRPTINEIIKNNTKVIFISLNLRKAVQLIREIYTKGLLWPKYAWIILVFDIETVLEEWADCDIKNALNGILLVETHTHEPFPPNAKLISGISYSTYYYQYLSSLEIIAEEYNTTLEPNAYAMVIYDTLWQMAVILNESCYQGTPCVNTIKINQGFFNNVATTFHVRTLTHCNCLQLLCILQLHHYRYYIK